MIKKRKILALILSLSVTVSATAFQDNYVYAAPEEASISEADASTPAATATLTGSQVYGSPTEVNPTDYVLTPTFNADSGHFESCTVTYQGQLQKSCYLLVQVIAPNEGEGPQPTYVVSDPSKSLEYTEYIILHFDTEGTGTIYNDENHKYLINLRWGGANKAPYYVYKGQILATGQGYVGRTDADGKYRHIAENGLVEGLYTGYFTDEEGGHVAFTGVLATPNANYTYYLFVPRDVSGATTYNMTQITPAQLYTDYKGAKALQDAKIYRIQRVKNSDGSYVYKGLVYNSTNVLPINGDTSKHYYVKSGKINMTDSPHYEFSLSSVAYRVQINGLATKFSGYFKCDTLGKYFFTDSNAKKITGTNLFATRTTAKDSDGRTYYKYTVADPATAAQYSSSNQNVYVIDSKGYTNAYYSGIVSLSYNSDTKDYFAKSGKILTNSTDAGYYIKKTHECYQITKDGVSISGYTGYFKDAIDGNYYFATNGNLRRGRYFLAVSKTENDLTSYTVISPAEAAKYPDAVIYYTNATTGVAKKYTGTKIVSFTYGESTYSYDVVSGKVNYNGTKTTYREINGIRYSISKTGAVTKYSGVYNGYYYYSGKPKTASEPYYVYYDKYIYKADTKGKLTKYYRDKKSTEKYYIVVYGASGKQYLLLASPNKATATVEIKDKAKTTTYTKAVDKLRWKVAYNTGVASLFTGVYNGSYYESGKVKTASATYYRVYGGYVYQINTKGVATKYIRDKSKTTAYKKYINGLYYNIYYNTGKIKKTYTSAETRQALIDKAFVYLGVKEYEAGHKEIVDTYNKATSGYDVKYSDSWCATYVSAMFIKCGLTEITALSCSCGRQVELWQKLGVWIENDAYVPKPGDIIYYHWDCTVKGDCTTWPGHVGIVVSCVDNFITVIEGNTSDMVGLKYREVDEACIRGYASPKY